LRFTTRWSDRPPVTPRIWIERTPEPHEHNRPDLADATLEELMSLAHELGHLDSYRRGTYVSTDDSSVSKDIRMREETSAWEYAERRLRSLRFSTWQSFYAHREAAIASHHNAP
jgi:hypothetical protein